jgi:hypothetical protein
MINWYYVQGSERIGPVGEETLRDLFHKEVLNLESYVWKKGFQNWERLKDVSELNFSHNSQSKNVSPVQNSPEINLNFEWRTIRDEDEIFFIKVGYDRKAQMDSDLFGPYSLTELREAITEKRINNRTLIFAAGMPGWIEVGDTPLDPINMNINSTKVKGSTPLLLVAANDPLPIIALIDEAGVSECTILGSGSFQAGSVWLCSIYLGAHLKAKNIKINIEEYSPMFQKAVCKIIEIDDQARKVIQNYA